MSDQDNPSTEEIARALKGLDPDPQTLSRNFTVEFSQIRCASCDMPFYVSKFWKEQRLKNGIGFYCPNGHSLHYPKEESDDR